MAGLIVPKGEIIIAERDGEVWLVLGDQPLTKMPPDVARAVAKEIERKADAAENKHVITIPSIKLY
jgi:hypothetical protein